MSNIKISSALISVFYKDGLAPIVKKLHEEGVTIYSTGGTQKFIEDLDIPVVPVEDLTSYPSIFGGRVKTLHPKVFGGILQRRDDDNDKKQAEEYKIPSIDLVIVDLYPFEETVASGAVEQDIIEKIDIGGISLIRAAAKNFKDVWIVSSRNQYDDVLTVLENGKGNTDISTRKRYAAEAFHISSHYDSAIFNYFNEENTVEAFKASYSEGKTLRYGENPHQKAAFYGPLSDLLNQLHGKELSYNNLVDIDAAINLIEEFDESDTAFAILKHTNACGCATGATVKDAYLRAFEADTISAFGGILITNKPVDKDAAEEITKLFCEVLIAPSFDEDALEILKTKKNRILLEKKANLTDKKQFKSLLNGVIVQDRDLKTDQKDDFETVTKKTATEAEISDLVFASKVCKHTKSNTIILARGNQLLASGVGQTSRVDALKQAIEKAKQFGFELEGSVMASDAFFPFPDCVEIADKAGITAVVQPGGSIKDKDSIDYCDSHNMAMVFTGTRHFKH
ncbi:bifunctional phosphoribosylaminoimidazolecarboxamide formyltransferase/IMP cyclohydrolase [Mangrovivirga cuniculi]|uniref:Bifunctional purine biosynthesis protein PurH n=1 Tax=Mangrovivirga cuniculi TaxID=2715131 RepID=A0A4D7JPM8_9BACT|nr:bifunctional phosphoribosylaminoimidazolecarboxamide formyltransferase/IMP cyclohydrolase [Mangrovivirga cuniculi]QCK13366.1 bifunctional phosphoribosylaminoimidazolecarboxamide formyltransferase/IMP cyclohydrolase PurH [Mangrovivirga cuniculi]